MLLQIDHSVVELFNSNQDTERDRISLGNLALAQFEGSHRIFAKRDELKYLLQLPFLSPQHKAALTRAYQSVSQTGTLIYKVQTYGRVVASVLEIPESTTENDQRIITFPLQWFDRTERIQPSVLLGEHLSDTEVYWLMGEVGALLATGGYLAIKADQWPGGGGASAAVLAHLAGLGKLCLCIADSDKASPTGSIGGTARALQQFSNTTEFPLIELAATTGRDLENALPDSFYISRYSNHPKHSKISQLLGRLTDLEEYDIRSHIDIEKGLALYDIWKCPTHAAERIFWIDKLDTLLSAQGHSRDDFQCLTPECCFHEKRHECECVVVEGNTSNILDDFTALYPRKSPHTLKTTVDVRGEWERLGLIVASWCCADDRVRI